ncbi:radical SAM protein [Endothiovibrio diazotrophicus]
MTTVEAPLHFHRKPAPVERKPIPFVTPEDFRPRVEGKTVYIFSVNLEGIGFLRRFTRLGLDVGGFIDSRPFKDGMKRGKPVIPPDTFFQGELSDAFVLITAKHRETRRWAIELCERHGLERNRGYMTSTDLCDYLPTIEVAGICNLHCISCNMGLPDANKAGGLMSAATYRQVLGKMSEEIPFINSVYLYLWGEPLVNLELPEILRISAEYGVATEISTNLTDARHLEPVVAAGPDVLVVPCSGVGENFGLTRTGGKWEKFRTNLFKLREYLDKHGVETVVRITYHLYKHNMERDYDEVEALARELGFQFLPVLAQIFPERVLRHVIYGEVIPEEMLRANEMLYYPIAEQLAYAQANKERICFMMKVFPTVRWNTSVVHCSNLMEPVLDPSYLDTPLEELLAHRDGNGFCTTCMDHGMHRFFDVSASVKMEQGRREVTRG